MSEYTKGPWTVNKEFGMQGMIDANEHPVAATCGYASPKGREANANLIAAAPDLFEALEAIVNDLPINRDWLNPDYENMAYAAIAKAKGES